MCVKTAPSPALWPKLLGEVPKVRNPPGSSPCALLARRNPDYRSSFPKGPAPLTAILPRIEKAAPNLQVLSSSQCQGEKRSNRLEIISGFLNPLHSNLLCLPLFGDLFAFG